MITSSENAWFLRTKPTKPPASFGKIPIKIRILNSKQLLENKLYVCELLKGYLFLLSFIDKGRQVSALVEATLCAANELKSSIQIHYSNQIYHFKENEYQSAKQTNLSTPNDRLFRSESPGQETNAHQHLTTKQLALETSNPIEQTKQNYEF